MPQRRKNHGAVGRVGLVACAVLIAGASGVSVAQDRTSADDSRIATGVVTRSEEADVRADWRVPQLETNSVISAALCFAVGFGACLLVVRGMLPSLVHAQCVEIVREMLDHSRRDSDLRVVILDRASHESIRKPRRASVPVTAVITESGIETQPHRRVDQPTAPSGLTDGRGGDVPNSMLSQIYEQNLHLRDQLRKQSRSVKQ